MLALRDYVKISWLGGRKSILGKNLDKKLFLVIEKEAPEDLRK
jgi:hypothetical protein